MKMNDIKLCTEYMVFNSSGPVLTVSLVIIFMLLFANKHDFTWY